MLSPDEILRISEGAEDIAEQLHQDILKRIIDRIIARLERQSEYLLTPVDKWQIETLQEAGYLVEDIQKEIIRRTNLQTQEVKAAFEDAGVRSAAYDDRIYKAAGLSPTPVLESPQYIRMMQRNYKKTLGEWRNFTGIIKDAAHQSFITECDRAYHLVASGAVSSTQAVREAVERMAADGVTVRYPSGREDTIETATMRAVRTGIAMASAEITLARMEEMDWDIIIVSSHLGARYTDENNYTNHFWWQGKFYSRTGRDKRFPPFSVCGYGHVQGISGANCRHSCGPGDGEFNPYDQFDSEENKRAYDLSQEQRAYERKIRATKRKTMSLKEGRDKADTDDLRKGLDKSYKKSAAKLQEQNKAYKEFCEKNGLKTRAERTQIARWDREQAAQARGAAKRYETEKLKTGSVNRKVDTETVEISLENGVEILTTGDNNDTIKSKWDNGLTPRGQVKERIGEDDLYDFVANELGASTERATEYTDAVMTFTDAQSDYYSEIRRYQRKEPLQFLSEAETQKMSDDIEEYIMKAPRWNGGETYRGSTVSDSELAQYIPGYEFGMGGTSSWSGTRQIAKDFAERNATPTRPNSVIYHCDTQSKGTGIKHISIYEGEDEVLCSMESRWEVVRTETDSDYITHVYVKEV